MTCAEATSRFSARRDGELSLAETRALSAHLEGCPACAAEWRDFDGALESLAALPRLQARGIVASRVYDRLEMERRQPGLAQLFRPFAAARPVLLPSLVPAGFVLAAVLTGALALDRVHEQALPRVVQGHDAWAAGMAPSGTESNPLFPSSEVSAPRVRSGDPLPGYLLDHPGEGTVFVETVVARDGSVSAVNVLGGDTELAPAVLDVLLRERYEPGRLRGRPVAVSIYRLISRMEVWAPIT